MIGLELIHKATQHFSEENKLGQGGLGPVYRVIKLVVGHLIFKAANSYCLSSYIGMKYEKEIVL